LEGKSVLMQEVSKKYTAEAVAIEVDIGAVVSAIEPEWEKRFKSLVHVPRETVIDALKRAYPGTSNDKLRHRYLFVWEKTIKVPVRVIVVCLSLSLLFVHS